MSVAFWRAFAAYLTSALGDTFYMVAVPLVLLQLGYLSGAATFLQTATMIATVIGGFLLGHVVDRYEPSRLLGASYAVSAVALGAAAVLIGAGVPEYPVALGVAGALGLVAAVSAAAMDAGVPRFVGDPGQVRRGYSLVESARATVSVVGPICAGVTVVFRSVVLVMLVNGATFVVAAVMAGGALPGRSDDDAPRRSLLRQVLAGGEAVLRNRPVLLGVALSLSINVPLGAEEVLVLTRMVVELRVPPAATSLVIAAASLVSVVLSYGAGRIGRSWPDRPAMAVSAFLVGVFAIGSGVADNVVLLAAAYCATAASTIFYTVNWRLYRQSLVPPALLGSVSSTCRSVAFLGIAVGSAAAGALQFAGVPAGTVLTAGGVLCATAVVVVGLGMVRVRTSADGAEPTSRPT